MFRRSTKGRNAARCVALALLSLVVVACGSSSSSSGSGGSASSGSSSSSGGSGKPINVLFISSNEGANAIGSVAQEKILQYLTGQWNASGGILGRKVNLIIKDDGGNATNGVSILRDELTSTHLDFVLNLADEFAEAPILKEDKILNGAEGGIAALDDQSTYPYTFGDVTVTSAYTQADDYWFLQHGYHKIAFIYADDFVTTPFVQTFEQTLKSFPTLKLVGTRSIESTQVDTTPQLTALRADNPDVLVVEGLPPSYGAIMRDLTNLGWHVPVLLSPGGIADTEAPTSVVPAADLKGVECLSYRDSLLPNGQPPASDEQLITLLHKVLGPSLPYSFRSYMFEWDEALMIKVGFDGAKSTNSDAVRTYLQSLSTNYPNPNPFYQHIDLNTQNHYPHDYSGFVFVNCGEPTTKDGLFKFAQYVPWPASLNVTPYPGS
jgi:branched-chain amino acid transport system substrate-binding protein